jgi:antitoxin YefM
MGAIYFCKTFMDAISYNTAAENLAETMDRVCDDHETIIVTRDEQRSIVMMSLADYNSLEETAFLLRSPKNAQRLLASIAELEAGNGKERELLD